MTDTLSGRPSLWRRFTAAYARLLSLLVVVSVGVLVVPVMLQIISRYTDLIPSYIWTEEMARFLFIWTVMIGTIIGVRESAHFDVDLLPALGARGDAFMRIVARLGVLVIAVVFVTGGITFTRFAWHRTSELAELPLWLIHIAWPVAGISWIVFLGEQLVDDLRTLLGKTSDA
jgi:TRAP-type C4-dicarboxylate transport system permease small subunit